MLLRRRRPRGRNRGYDTAVELLSGRTRIVATVVRYKATTWGLAESASKNGDTCADCVLTEAAYLDHPTAMSKGWPIATGVIEGACRHLVKDRM
jgi:hypothetical protein